MNFEVPSKMSKGSGLEESPSNVQSANEGLESKQKLISRINFIVSTLEKREVPVLPAITIRKIYRGIRNAFSSHITDKIIDDITKNKGAYELEDVVSIYISDVIKFFKEFEGGQKVGFTQEGELVVESERSIVTITRVPATLFLEVYGLSTPLKEIIKDDEELTALHRENKLTDSDLPHSVVYRVLRHMIGDRIYDYNGKVEKIQASELKINKPIPFDEDLVDEDDLDLFDYLDSINEDIFVAEDMHNRVVEKYFEARRNKKATEETFRRIDNEKKKEESRMFRDEN